MQTFTQFLHLEPPEFQLYPLHKESAAQDHAKYSFHGDEVLSAHSHPISDLIYQSKVFSHI